MREGEARQLPAAKYYGLLLPTFPERLKGRIIARGKLVSRGQAKRADYIVYYKPNIPLALIGAKDNSHSDGMRQGLEYATTLDIPFVYSSNGDGFVFMTAPAPAHRFALRFERFRAAA